MTSLTPLLLDQIQRNGALTLAAYMQLALQHPDFGYYRRGDRLGRAGDFITAPEISQMFGEMIGLWCVGLWRQIGSPESFTLLEMGPGRGTLMQDVLRATAKIKGFHAGMELCLMESNVTFRQMQTEKLKDFPVRFCEKLSEIPPKPILIIANEFFDALPIRQFEKQFSGWHERRVDVVNGALSLTLHPIGSDLEMLIPPESYASSVGTIVETSLTSLLVLRDLARHIRQWGGAALIIDYGSEAPSGQATLQAVSDHQSVSILERPGEVDLTAHVDFGALRAVALKEGVRADSPITQGEFLRNMGIDIRADALKIHATEDQIQDINKALHRLTNASEMGQLFKALAVVQQGTIVVPGF